MSDILAKHKATLKQLADLVDEERACAAQIYAEGVAPEIHPNLSKLDEKFLVLFIGCFSSGKSYMINALIGEELLPHGFLPTTAFVTELRYGEKKSVRLYPKKGKWEGGDEPFEIEPAPEAISKYVSLINDNTINSWDCGRINSKFEKIIIQWPAEFLKDGLILVDTPGINDPYSNDYIFENYLPHADVIVYVMDSQHAYLGTDKQELKTINALRCRNIITAYTFYDIIEHYCRKNPERLKELRNKLVSCMNQHTELGVDSVHFLDSMSGLDAKLDDDPNLWRKSGYESFEKFLCEYLVKGTGAEQIRSLVEAIISQADAMLEHIAKINRLNEMTDSERCQSLETEELALQAEQEELSQAMREYRARWENYLPKLEQVIREFLTNELPQRVNLDDFELELELPDGPRRLWPSYNRARIRAAQKECREELQRRMNLEYRKWNVNTLSKELQAAITDILDGENLSFGKLRVTQLTYITLEIIQVQIIERLPLHMCERLGEEIKAQELDDFRKFFVAPYFKEEVDIMIADIVTDAEVYFDNACAKVERTVKSKVGQTARQLCADGSTRIEKIYRENAAEKLLDIKNRALNISESAGIKNLFNGR